MSITYNDWKEEERIRLEEIVENSENHSRYFHTLLGDEPWKVKEHMQSRNYFRMLASSTRRDLKKLDADKKYLSYLFFGKLFDYIRTVKTYIFK
ncbi:hypothetical protein CL617_05850 [archaeon]|nr:hypothetical protein [archaeon]|tara:strand:+ start:16366 stop:16647 length:282 start_codon:yes stop_codon:yes gene_type:complete